MLGFIKKDLLVIRSNMKFLLVIFVLYILMALDGDMSLAFLPTFLSIFLMMGGFSYDNYNNWDSYAISLPEGRKNVVRAKYIATLIILIISSLLVLGTSLGLHFIKPDLIVIKDTLLSILISVIVAIVLLSITYPVIFKIGIEKARIAMFGIAFGIVAIVVLIIRFVKVPKEIGSFLSNNAVILSILVVLGILYGSYKLSLRIYRKKEF